MLSKTLEPHSLEGFQNVIERNVVGDFNIIRLAVKEMLDNKISDREERGVIINTSRYLCLIHLIRIVYLQLMDLDIKLLILQQWQQYPE